MNELTYTLLSDGSSDRGLLPVLSWLLGQHLPRTAIQRQWADLSRVRRPGQPLSATIGITIAYYPCDLLFIHRDAETASREDRVAEIKRALEKGVSAGYPAVCVVPVRMTEAWLLFDQTAIRRAAGNPSGRVKLDLPRPRDVEALPDPKKVLHALLLIATELGRARRKKVQVGNAARRVSEYVSDFSPLRLLAAFAALEGDVQQALREKGW